MSSYDPLHCPSERDHQAFLDDQLDDSSRQLLVQHVEECEHCQSVCESLVAKLEQGHHSTLCEPVIAESPIGRVMQAVKDRWSATENAATDRQPFEPRDLLALGTEFQLLHRLGQGSQGVVYRAKDLNLQREVVIKLLAPKMLQSPEFVERFKREARLLASIQSPYVVPIFRVGELPSGKMFMVMEFVQGTTLREYRQSETLGIHQSATIAKQIAVGLSAVHQKHLVHRDLKPENILMDAQDQQVRIADFGLAFDSNEEARITMEGTLAGTPAYMSPEQVLHPQSVDFRADLYSLGVVLYELLTSQVPFRGTTRMTLLQLVHEDPVPPRTYNEKIPKDLETICLKALSKEPVKRFQSAEDFAEELQRFLSDQPILSRPTGRFERMWRKMRKNPVVSSLAATVALLVCVATALSFAYAVHYRSLNTRVEQNALIAKQQRDSALSTLVELVFELQRKFDSDDIFIDEIQQSSLEIAMRGLEKVEGIAGTSNEGGLAMAVALRRLGQTLYNLDRIDESSRCLQKSEQLLRQLVARQPRHQPILMALADTVIAYDECLDEEDDMAQLARFEFAVARCQTIASDHSPEFLEKLAKLLSSQAKCQMQNHLVEKALESLREAERILPSPSVSDASQPRSQPRSLLITTLQVQTLYASAYRLHDDMPAARTHAAKALSQIQQAGQSLEEDSSVIQVQLCCLELLGCLAKKAEPNVEPAWQTMYTELRERMLKLAETDGQDFAVVSEIVMQLVSDRVNEGIAFGSYGSIDAAHRFGRGATCPLARRSRCSARPFGLPCCSGGYRNRTRFTKKLASRRRALFPGIHLLRAVERGGAP